MASGQGVADPKVGSRRKKLIAITIASVLAGSGAILIWNEYYRHWTVEDLAEAVTENPAAPGFKDSLANKTVTVEGIVTKISHMNTTLGGLNLVELDGFVYINLVYWNDVDFVVGDEIEADISFERSCYNGESHVYSPQLDFPALFSTLGMETVTFAVSHVQDMFWTVATDDNVTTIAFEWVGEEMPLSDCNCSLRQGEYSWTMEYIDLMGTTDYGTDITGSASLSTLVSSDGPMAYDDVDGDGNLSVGDTIRLRGLETPEVDSGFKCYLLLLGSPQFLEKSNVGFLSMYLPMTNRGMLRNMDATRSMAFMGLSDAPDGFLAEVDFAAYPIQWSDTYADLTCSVGTDMGETEFTTIDPFAEGLGQEGVTTWTSGPFDCCGFLWVVNVTDADGDGAVSAGDSIAVVTADADAEASLEYLSLSLTYSPSGTRIDSVEMIDIS